MYYIRMLKFNFKILFPYIILLKLTKYIYYM